jgi:L-alanine-DL-glutamate epimerase-like enolase superfamily enzyme
MRVTETAHWLEGQDWADPVLQKPYEIRDGLLHIPDVPGVGSGLAHRRAEVRTTKLTQGAPGTRLIGCIA